VHAQLPAWLDCHQLSISYWKAAVQTCAHPALLAATGVG